MASSFGTSFDDKAVDLSENLTPVEPATVEVDSKVADQYKAFLANQKQASPVVAPAPAPATLNVDNSAYAKYKAFQAAKAAKAAKAAQVASV